MTSLAPAACSDHEFNDSIRDPALEETLQSCLFCGHLEQLDTAVLPASQSGPSRRTPR